MSSTRPKPGTRVIAVLVAAALTALMTVAQAGVALAASGKWAIQATPNVTVPGGQLGSVSCPSANACTAVGSDLNASGVTVTLAEAWNGTSWRRQSTPNPAGHTIAPALLGVSCPSAGFCEAVGGYTVGTTGIILAETWNGSSWATQSVPAPSGSTSAVLHAVSCPSPTFCEAVGFYDTSSGAVVPLAEMWNGTAWSVQSTPSPAGTIVELGGVSCVSANFCEAVGGNPLFADVWNGTSWELQSIPGTSGSGLGPVSCVSVSFCEAVGGDGGAVWNGTAWSAVPIPVPAGNFATFGGVSCTSTTSCEAVGSYTSGSGTYFTLGEGWNGTAWSIQSTPGVAGASVTSLGDVSCATAGACEAVGEYQQTPGSPTLKALAETWNGSAWTTQSPARPGAAVANSLNAVSCVSATFCEAVGTASDGSGNAIGLAEVWNGTTWKTQSFPNPVQASSGVRAILRGVSCVSAQFCEAVGNSSTTPGAGAWVWNGTSWTAQTITGSAGLTSVSCPSASFCEAVSGNAGTNTWNGTSWSAQSASASGFSSLSSVSCPSATFCEAVGLGPSGEDAETWNGSSWSAQSTPSPSGGSSLDLNAVSCAKAGFCETVGWYLSSTFAQLTVAERWTGTAWVAQATPNPTASTDNSLLGVSCTSASSCTSVGFAAPVITNDTLAEVWNGSSWSLQSSPNRPNANNNVLNGVSCGAAQTCTAVGVTTDQGQIGATLAEAGD